MASPRAACPDIRKRTVGEPGWKAISVAIRQPVAQRRGRSGRVDRE
jgi:hypothetical protein